METKKKTTIYKVLQALIVSTLITLVLAAGTLAGLSGSAYYLTPFNAAYNVFIKPANSTPDVVQWILLILDGPLLIVISIVVLAILLKRVIPQIKKIPYKTEPLSLAKFTPHTLAFALLIGVILQKLSITIVFLLIANF